MINQMNSLYSETLRQVQNVSQKSPVHNTEKDNDAFSSILKDSLQSLESKQSESADAVRSLIDGSADDLHTVMIKTTEAQLSLEVAVQLRNRALEAYNEIKNMQF